MMSETKEVDLTPSEVDYLLRLVRKAAPPPGLTTQGKLVMMRLVEIQGRLMREQPDWYDRQAEKGKLHPSAKAHPTIHELLDALDVPRERKPEHRDPGPRPPWAGMDFGHE